MTKVVFSFIICMAIYFVVLGIIAIVKKMKAKRKYKKDLEKSKVVEEIKKDEEIK